MHTTHRGFTLLIAVVLASVSLSIGLALLEIAYKQVVLSSGARQSQTAFYNADSALECALYWDQQMDAFNYTTPLTSIQCKTFTLTVTPNDSVNPHQRSFTLPCDAGGTTVSGQVVVTKASDAETGIYATGYNVCDPTNTRRIERGLKATY